MSPSRVEVVLAVENTARQRGLLAEHGLSYWLRWGERSVLFDCGQGAALPANAPRLGLALSEVTDVVFSHGHYDHAGGLAAVLAAGARPRLFAHPSAWGERFSRHRDGFEPVDAGQEVRAAVAARGFTAVSAPTEVAPGLFATGEIPRLAEESGPAGFALDPRGTRPDPLLDDQALFFETPEGWVVLLGCAHAGVVSTLRHVQALTGAASFALVVGGMHLSGAGAARLAWTVEALRSLPVRRLVPLHCTGRAAQARLAENLTRAFEEATVGQRFELALVPGRLR